jgi:pyruvate dehydrogenase E1 component alpha subunit
MKWASELVAFESRIKELFAQGELPFLIHLSGGNEAQLIDIFREIKPADWVLASHRNHYHYLLKGGSPERLEADIRRGKSMFVFDKKINFVTSAILGGACGIAAGIGLSIAEAGGPEKVWCFLGDGAFDNGHAFEAIMFVEARRLPCTFIIEDNDRSVDTDKTERSGPAWKFPFDSFRCVRRYEYTPTYPHGGAGLKTMIEFKKERIKEHISRERREIHERET